MVRSFLRCFSLLLIFTFAFLIEFASRLVLLVGPSGLEPPTSCLSGTRSNLLSYDPMWYLAEVVLTLDLPCGGDDGIPTVSLREPVRIASDAEPEGSYIHLSLGGDDGIRTHDPLLAGQVLSQLSYTPILNGS